MIWAKRGNSASHLKAQRLQTAPRLKKIEKKSHFTPYNQGEQ
jgi:hypothetical protein